MYFYITLHCIGYSPSIPLSRHQGPTIPYYPPSLGPIPLLRVPSSSYSLLLTASLYDPVPGSNRWNPCTHVHPCQGVDVRRPCRARHRVHAAPNAKVEQPSRRRTTDLLFHRKMPQSLPSCSREGSLAPAHGRAGSSFSAGFDPICKRGVPPDSLAHTAYGCMLGA